MYFNRDHADPQADDRYLSQNDTSVLHKKDLRKMRLTLRDLNEIRKAGEAHDKEKNEELDVIRKMYAAPTSAEAPPR